MMSKVRGCSTLIFLRNLNLGEPCGAPGPPGISLITADSQLVPKSVECEIPLSLWFVFPLSQVLQLSISLSLIWLTLKFVDIMFLFIVELWRMRRKMKQRKASLGFQGRNLGKGTAKKYVPPRWFQFIMVWTVAAASPLWNCVSLFWDNPLLIFNHIDETEAEREEAPRTSQETGIEQLCHSWAKGAVLMLQRKLRDVGILMLLARVRRINTGVLEVVSML